MDDIFRPGQGLYLGTPASAIVVADEEGLAYHLSAAALARMEAEAPELAAAFHRFMAQHLSERLVSTTEVLGAVMN